MKLEQQRLYDASCKKLLSQKPILAFILKHCVDAFREASIEEIIATCIEQVEVSAVGVNPDESNPTEESSYVSSRIAGLNVEDSTVTEGTIYYDIRFFATTPQKDRVRMIINIEAQTSEQLHYPLLMRGIYYGCRLISSQKEVEFTGSHYENIKKAYSIWICTNPKKTKENSINRYFITEQQVYGNVKEEKETYDLMEVIFVRLNNDYNLSENELIEFLSTLFSPYLSSTEKLKDMAKELGVSMNHTIESEVEHMCNLSQGVYNNGLEKGLAQGLAQGSNKKMRTMVFNMLSKHLEDSLIMDIASITVDQLESLKQEWSKQQQ